MIIGFTTKINKRLTVDEFQKYKNGEKEIIEVKRAGTDIFKGDTILLEGNDSKGYQGKIGLFEVVGQSICDKQTDIYTLKIKYST